MANLPKLNPLSRNPLLEFRDVEVTAAPAADRGTFAWSEGGNTNATVFLGKVKATASYAGYAPTPMYFRVAVVENRANGAAASSYRRHVVLGSRCGLLHTPQINARTKGAESLWCTNCWSDCAAGDGVGGVVLPFYLYYRHYDDHVIGQMPNCAHCNKKFQVWEADVPLRPDHAYLFSGIRNAGLQRAVEERLGEMGVAGFTAAERSRAVRLDAETHEGLAMAVMEPDRLARMAERAGLDFIDYVDQI